MSYRDRLNLKQTLDKLFDFQSLDPSSIKLHEIIGVNEVLEIQNI